MKKISLEDYKTLSSEAQVLAADAYGDKVLRRKDGSIIKLFRLKRAWSSARLRPYAARFARNAQMLKKHGFITVEVLQVTRVAELKRDIVLYRELPGRTLRDTLMDPDIPADTLAELFTGLCGLLARLHHKGILFRSIHFGNVLVQPDGGLALIDVADLRKHIFPLRATQRIRNFRHMLRYAQDRRLLASFGASKFIDLYSSGDITRGTRQKLETALSSCLDGERGRSN